LVNEAYLRLADQTNPTWQSRAHFFAVAARAMRGILVNYAKSNRAQKRGGGAVRIELDEAAILSPEQSKEIVDLHEALERLATLNSRKARVVELKYFGGLHHDEIAEVMKISTVTGTDYKGGGDYFFYNFAAVTPALPPADRQSFYGSFMRDVCDKYLTVFADFKYVRSFFDASLAAVPFAPDPFKIPGTNIGFSPSGISVPISNPFNPFIVADATIPSFFPDGSGLPVTTGVRFRGINDTGPRHEKFTYWDQLFDLGLRGEMGEFGGYFKTWNWELGFRYSRNEGQDLSVGEASQPGLREALLDTNPATAFDPFLNFNAHNTNAARQRVYVTLHNSGEYELPIGYVTLNGDLFNLPAGPVSFALGGEYDAPRWTRDRDVLNTTFQSIGSADGGSARVNRDVWSIYQEVRVPFTSPTWNVPAFFSFEVDFAEREEWYSQNTSAVLPSGAFPFQPATHSQYKAQKPKVRFVGSQSIQNISERLPCVAATPKRFMLRLYRRFRLLPRRASHRSWTRF
jgi:hypothetical protein